MLPTSFAKSHLKSPRQPAQPQRTRYKQSRPDIGSVEAHAGTAQMEHIMRYINQTITHYKPQMGTGAPEKPSRSSWAGGGRFTSRSQSHRQPPLFDAEYPG